MFTGKSYNTRDALRFMNHLFDPDSHPDQPRKSRRKPRSRAAKRKQPRK